MHGCTKPSMYLQPVRHVAIFSQACLASSEVGLISCHAVDVALRCHAINSTTNESPAGNTWYSLQDELTTTFVVGLRSCNSIQCMSAFPSAIFSSLQVLKIRPFSRFLGFATELTALNFLKVLMI